MLLKEIEKYYPELYTESQLYRGLYILKAWDTRHHPRHLVGVGTTEKELYKDCMKTIRRRFDY